MVAAGGLQAEVTFLIKDEVVHRPSSIGPAIAPRLTIAPTLMWIGDRESPQASPAYAFCESHAPQVAFRPSIEDANSRPASAVGQIVLSRRRDADRRSLETLIEQYSPVRCLELLGPLAQPRPNTGAGEFAAPCHYQRCRWHQWNQLLPAWFPSAMSGGEWSRGPRTAAPNAAAPQSILVVTDSLSHADPYLDLITSQGAAAVWSRRPDRAAVRGMDAVWWDDSAAPPTTASVWRERIGATGVREPSQHLWMVGAPQLRDVRQAQLGGVGAVTSKPAEIDALTRWWKVGSTVTPLCNRNRRAA